MRKLLQDAEAQKPLERDGQEALRILPPLAAAIRRGWAVHLVYHAHCVRLALADMERKSAVA